MFIETKISESKYSTQLAEAEPKITKKSFAIKMSFVQSRSALITCDLTIT